jgi:hypothetical protein
MVLDLWRMRNIDKNDDKYFERNYMERYNELQNMIREGNDLLQEIQER